MSKANEHRPGFKHTPLGWIPQEWNVLPVGKAFKICNNLRFPISEEVRKTITGQYPYYGPTKVQDYINEYRIEGKYALIGEDGDHFLKWRELPMTLLVEGQFNVNNHAHLIQGNGISITEWFFYFFNHRELTTHLTRQGAGRYKLTKEALSKMPVALPSLLEQHRISTILSTWDEAITKTRQLIAQLQQRNKGLMQQLLTVRTRLKGFEGDVHTHHLKEFITEVSKKNRNGKVERVLSVTNSRGFISQSELFDREVASEDRSNYKIVRKGQFAYNPSRVNVGSLDLLRTFDEGILSPMYVVFETDSKRLLPLFLYYHLKSHWFFKHIPMYVQGSVRDSLSFDGLTAMKFFIPPVEEQSIIVKILDSAHDEVKLYEQKLSALQQQKKGLMQKLLTGEVRTI